VTSWLQTVSNGAADMERAQSSASAGSVRPAKRSWDGAVEPSAHSDGPSAGRQSQLRHESFPPKIVSLSAGGRQDSPPEHGVEEISRTAPRTYRHEQLEVAYEEGVPDEARAAGQRTRGRGRRLPGQSELGHPRSPRLRAASDAFVHDCDQGGLWPFTGGAAQVLIEGPQRRIVSDRDQRH
jgi:hypothetical protein